MTYTVIVNVVPMYFVAAQDGYIHYCYTPQYN